MSESSKQPRRPKPWLAVGLTIGLAGLAVDQQVSTGKVDHFLLGILVVLAFFWAGESVNRLVDKWLG